MASDGPDPRVVEKFRDLGVLPDDAVPVASLTLLWYLDPAGRDYLVTMMDGNQRTSITIGDLTQYIHGLAHEVRDQ